MDTEPPVMTIMPIGFVRSPVREMTPSGYNWHKVIAEIEVDEGLTDALDGIEEYSHIIVLYWINRARRPAPMKVHPRGDPERAERGVFSTRSPSRPNPIGKATVKLLERKANILRVQGLDAIDGSPVLDIKPYIPGYDSGPYFLEISD